MYARLCTCGTLHNKACRIGPGREGDRKPEKPGRHSSEGGEVASRLADNEIVLPSRTGYIPQMSDLSRFSTKRARPEASLSPSDSLGAVFRLGILAKRGRVASTRELRRIPLPRTPVNKGNRKSR